AGPPVIRLVNFRSGPPSGRRGIARFCPIGAAGGPMAELSWRSTASGGPEDALSQYREAARDEQQGAPERRHAEQLDHDDDNRDQDDREESLAAVIDEQADEFAKRGAKSFHWTAHSDFMVLEARSRPTAASEKAASREKIGRSAKSAPAHCAPTPSPIQNSPKVVSIKPTTNLSEFAGTRPKGRCTTSPMASTRMNAASAPRPA